MRIHILTLKYLGTLQLTHKIMTSATIIGTICGNINSDINVQVLRQCQFSSRASELLPFPYHFTIHICLTRCLLINPIYTE